MEKDGGGGRFEPRNKLLLRSALPNAGNDSYLLNQLV